MTAALTQPTYARTANYPPQAGALTGTYLSALAAVTVEEWTPAAVSTNAIKTSIASSTSAVSYSGAALNGSIGAGAISPPRNITVTTASTAANAPATVTVTGTDIDGAVQTETISGVNGGAATYTTVKTFASVTNIAAPGGSGTGATLVFGIGGILGLARQAKTRGGALGVVSEIANGSVVTTGAFVIAATSVPNGSYAPSAAPDGTKKYALYYEAATQ